MSAGMGVARTGALVGLVLSLLITALLPAEASAQYFGRNKVQYESFDFKVLETDHFRIHYYPEEEEAVRDAALMAERWYERLTRVFNHRFQTKKPIVLYADHPDFQQTNTTRGVLSQGTGGFTESLKDRVVMPLTGSYWDTDHVLGHELVHAFQYDIAKAGGNIGRAGLGSLPLWLVEGMAEYLSVGREDTHTAMWLRDAALRGDLPTIRQLTVDPRFFPYRYGQALWAYVGGRWGDRAVTELYKTALRQGWQRGLKRVLGMDENQLSQEWMTSIRESYLPMMQGRDRAEDIAETVLSQDIDAGDMNVGPVVSPDGSRVAFFSERDLFEVKLFVADAHTGEVLEELAASQADIHTDALSYLSSAGTWSPDGRRFAFTVFAEGNSQIAIMEVAGGDLIRRVEVEGIGEMRNAAWSPDGRTIAFSGMVGGISDLYLIEVETGSVQQLTDDKYADFQPTWSPDGRTIAWVTDRGTTSFGRLEYGHMRIATMDMGSRQVRVLDLFPSGKHIDPKFSPDGNSLYFIADVDGFTDIYRAELDSGRLFRVTRLATGVSGITSLSPALTVASESGRVMFSVFDGGNFTVFGMEPERAQGSALEVQLEPVAEAGVLPPLEAARRGIIANYLEDPDTGLPEGVDYAAQDYDAGLSLDYVGVPTVGVSNDQFGTGFSGAAAGFFSDMLGDRNLGVAVQANGGVEDIGGQVFYQNRKNQWNWGAIAGHIPFQTGGFNFFRDTVSVDVDDEQRTVVADVLELQRFRVFQDRITGIVDYPFSQTMRVEMDAGLTRYGFSLEAEQFFFLPGTQQQIGSRRIDLPDLPGFENDVYLGNVSAALVHDNSFFGFTSPIRGGRYRLEVSPTFGSLQYMTALADWRRYFFNYPFTFAMRGLHFGRYGRDANTNEGIIRPLFLGFETLVRGYSIESFTAEDCATSRCPALERLLGSKIAVANLELRLPLLGFSEFGLINFPFLPTELVAFADAGMAWTGDDDGFGLEFELESRSDKRIPVFSTGIAARTNVMGFLILETYYAYPFQRPDKGAHFGFVLSPGW